MRPALALHRSTLIVLNLVASLLLNTFLIPSTFWLSDNSSSIASTPPAASLTTDVDHVINLATSVDLDARRAALRHYLWGTASPGSSPVTIGPAVDALVKLPQVATARTLTVRMSLGIESRVPHLRPRSPRGATVLYHRGHEYQPDAGTDTVAALLSAGYDVLVFSMPLLPPNNQPIVDLPHFGRTQLVIHDQMNLLEPPGGGSPLQFFLEPVVAVLNTLEGEGPLPPVAMTGLSGGGWTTTIIAAIDTRIAASYPVAGSLPIYLRGERDWGDWEQTEVGFYRLANYLELYVLGGSGAGRHQVQILNAFDPCCFAGHVAESYAPAVARRVASIGPGGWGLHVDDTHHSHVISPAVLALILADLESTLQSGGTR